jgi:hypothetical protein
VSSTRPGSVLQLVFDFVARAINLMLGISDGIADDLLQATNGLFAQADDLSLLMLLSGRLLCCWR